MNFYHLMIPGVMRNKYMLKRRRQEIDTAVQAAKVNQGVNQQGVFTTFRPGSIPSPEMGYPTPTSPPFNQQQNFFANSKDKVSCRSTSSFISWYVRSILSHLKLVSVARLSCSASPSNIFVWRLANSAETLFQICWSPFSMRS